MLALGGNISQVFWLAAIPAALAMVVLIWAVREPKGDHAGKPSDFSLRAVMQLNSAVWAAIGLSALIMMARFSEAFVLLKALQAGFSAT